MAAQILTDAQTNFAELQESIVEFEEKVNRLIGKFEIAWGTWESRRVLQKDVKKVNSKLARMCERAGQLKRDIESHIKNDPEHTYRDPNKEVMANSTTIPVILSEKALEFIQRQFQNLEIVRAISPAVKEMLFNAELEPLQAQIIRMEEDASASSSRE
jgi:hypothetical protein